MRDGDGEKIRKGRNPKRRERSETLRRKYVRRLKEEASTPATV